MRIDNIKQRKQEDDAFKENNELTEIKGQSIKAEATSKFTVDSQLQNSGCLSCLTPSYNIMIKANLDKVLYYPSETLKMNIEIDNRQSQRRIQSINCYLRQTISILKADNSRNYWTETYALHRIQINKANLAHNMYKTKDAKGSNKRVYGEF